ncbi:uncharacterized protein [Argopecten irradians]|uniref:uncharacterized protein n=1 Tax=Argopecten irradians TaxID=31199 RepID=UPI003717D99B
MGFLIHGYAFKTAGKMGEQPSLPPRSIGNIGQFDEAVETWESYTERVELYFTANGVSNDLKVVSFLSVIGRKTYSLLKSIAAPGKPVELTYAQILQFLNGQPSVIAERFRFHKRDQRQDEGIMSHVAEIRKLSLHCNFGDNLNDTQRDRLVCGINTENIQKRLLSERTLTLDKVIALAVAMKTASKDAVELREQRHVIGAVNKLHTTGKGSNSSKTSSPQLKTPTRSSALKLMLYICRCGGLHRVEN